MRLTDSRYEEIKQLITDLLSDYSISILPIDVFLLAKKMAIKVCKYSEFIVDERIKIISASQLKPNGEFSMMRFYDKNHYLVKEIAYHPERYLDSSRKPILHIHEYEPGNLSNRPNRLLTAQEYEKYKKYFGGKLRWKADE